MEHETDRVNNEGQVTPSSKPSVVAGEPGYGLGIAGFIVSFFASLIGLILSAIALKQSKEIGKRNPFALAGLIIGIVQTALWTLFAILMIILITVGVSYCSKSGVTCNSNNTNNSYNQGNTQDGSSSGPSQTY